MRASFVIFQRSLDAINTGDLTVNCDRQECIMALKPGSPWPRSWLPPLWIPRHSHHSATGPRNKKVLSVTHLRLTGRDSRESLRDSVQYELRRGFLQHSISYYSPNLMTIDQGKASCEKKNGAVFIFSTFRWVKIQIREDEIIIVLSRRSCFYK